MSGIDTEAQPRFTGQNPEVLKQQPSSEVVEQTVDQEEFWKRRPDLPPAVAKKFSRTVQADYDSISE